jgi:hypothetical protein
MTIGGQSRSRALLGTMSILSLAFIGIQFIRPELNNPPVTGDLQATPEVKNILQNSCYACHSNQTSAFQPEPSAQAP